VSELSRNLLRLVAAALCVAALAAIVAILSGGFGDDDWNVIGTSVLFAITASTGGAGASLRLRGTEGAIVLGTLVMTASAVTFGLVSAGVWAGVDGEGFLRVAGTAAIIAVDGAHACFVLARRRPNDPEGVQLATTAAVVAAGISGTFGILAATGLAEGGPWEPLAVVLVIQLLATALSLLLRRTARDQPIKTADLAGADQPRDVAGELHVIADALDKAGSPVAVRELANQLRHLARRA
jgi:hypothetical protein